MNDLDSRFIMELKRRDRLRRIALTTLTLFMIAPLCVSTLLIYRAILPQSDLPSSHIALLNNEVQRQKAELAEVRRHADIQHAELTQVKAEAARQKTALAEERADIQHALAQAKAEAARQLAKVRKRADIQYIELAQAKAEVDRQLAEVRQSADIQHAELTQAKAEVERQKIALAEVLDKAEADPQQLHRTEQVNGTVVSVDRDTILVRTPKDDYGFRMLQPSESTRFILDGKELKLTELKPGTWLNTTATMTTDPITERSVKVGAGKVLFVSGNDVILKLPNNEVRQYYVPDSHGLIVNGKSVSTDDLHQGMTVTAEKIVEVPRTKIRNNVQVTKLPVP